jgi:hypothetical protein
MQPQTRHSELRGWQRLVGTWATEATHPQLPGTVVTGQATFEWLEDQRFLLQRSHYDHPEIPMRLRSPGSSMGSRPCTTSTPAACTGCSRLRSRQTRGDSGTTRPGSRSDLPTRSATTTTRSTVRPSCHAMTVVHGSTTSRSLTAGSADMPAAGAADMTARAIIGASLFLVLATADGTGRPWSSPVYFAPRWVRGVPLGLRAGRRCTRATSQHVCNSAS